MYIALYQGIKVLWVGWYGYCITLSVIFWRRYELPKLSLPEIMVIEASGYF